MLMSGIINGVDPATGKVAPTLEQQCHFIFQHVRAIMARPAAVRTISSR